MTTITTQQSQWSAILTVTTAGTKLHVDATQGGCQPHPQLLLHECSLCDFRLTQILGEWWHAVDSLPCIYGSRDTEAKLEVEALHQLRSHSHSSPHRFSQGRLVGENESVRKEGEEECGRCHAIVAVVNWYLVAEIMPLDHSEVANLTITDRENKPARMITMCDQMHE
jgi:hypothetical protein